MAPEKSPEVQRLSIPEANPVARVLRYKIWVLEDSGEGVMTSYRLAPALAILIYVWVHGHRGRGSVSVGRAKAALQLGPRFNELLGVLTDERFLARSGDLLGPGPELLAAPTQFSVVPWEEAFRRLPGAYVPVAVLWCLADLVPAAGGTDRVRQKDVAQALGLGERIVRDAFLTLESAGLLGREPRPGGTTRLFWPGPEGASDDGEQVTPDVLVAGPADGGEPGLGPGAGDAGRPEREADGTDLSATGQPHTPRPPPGSGAPLQALPPVGHFRFGAHTVRLPPESVVEIERLDDGTTLVKVGGRPLLRYQD